MAAFTSVVTGAAGFLGSHLVDQLLSQGHRVIGYDNLITGDLANLHHLRRDASFEFVQQDICRPLTVTGPVHFVWHFASPASPVDYLALPLETLQVGSQGTWNLLDLALQKNARFLLTSTSEVYGDPLVHPQPESYWGHVNSIGPRSCYDESKRFAEALTMSFHRKHQLAIRIVRIFNTYGPRMRRNDGRVVPAFIGQALRGEPLTVFGGGYQTRSFCYYTDLLAGIVRLMFCEADEAHLPTNIGNPHELTIREFALAILAATQSKSVLVEKPLPQDDPKQRRPDITRAQNILGWSPTVSLEEGLRETIQYFRDQVSS